MREENIFNKDILDRYKSILGSSFNIDEDGEIDFDNIDFDSFGFNYRVDRVDNNIESDADRDLRERKELSISRNKKIDDILG